MATVRVLAPGDEEILRAFLQAHPDTTMFMQGNLHAAGLEDRGERLQGTYVGVFEDGALVGALCHAWNGVFLLEAPAGLEEALALALRTTGRAVRGFSGSLPQVLAARTRLGLDDAEALLDSAEVLYALDLDRLQVPAALADGAVTVRRAGPQDLPVLTPWGVAYRRESIHEEPGPTLDARVASSLREGLEERTVWIAHADGVPVSQTRFNATTPEAVQVGGVYTPPAFRSRGYAACAVAQSLLDARAEGARRSILFTEEHNTPARRCYEGLGYERIGRYGLVWLRDLQDVSA